MPETLLHEPPNETTHTAPPELERVLAMRRDELKPDVRTYADNLHTQILAIFAEHGAKNYADFERIAREQHLPVSLLEALNKKAQRLLSTVETGEVPERTELQRWMQDVYNELGIETDVPLPPELTEEQKEAFQHYGFRLFYIPSITEDQYPQDFVKPNGRSNNLDVSKIERKPLSGQWVAIETIEKPNHDDPTGFPNDALAKALKLQTRFNVSFDDLHGDAGLLSKIADLTHSPKDKTRLPTVEEWNIIANLMNWLKNHRNDTTLKDLGATNSWEWAENTFEPNDRCIVGHRGNGGLGAVSGHWTAVPDDRVAFRVLVEFK